MMDSVDLYPSKPAIDITIDILFYYIRGTRGQIMPSGDRYHDRYPTRAKTLHTIRARLDRQ